MTAFASAPPAEAPKTGDGSLVGCSSCFVDKPASHFGRGKKCRRCVAQVHRAWCRKNRDHVRQLARSWYKANAGKISRAIARDKATNLPKYILRRVKYSAKRLGLRFNLDESDIVIPALCPICGIPVAHTPGKTTEGSPSVDRIDPRKGYVKGNVAIISCRGNRIKNDATADELIAAALYILRHKPKTQTKKKT